MESAHPLLIEVGPNLLVVLLAIISAVSATVAAVHANEARQNSAATRAIVTKATRQGDNQPT